MLELVFWTLGLVAIPMCLAALESWVFGDDPGFGPPVVDGHESRLSRSEVAPATRTQSPVETHIYYAQAGLSEDGRAPAPQETAHPESSRVA